MYTYEVFVHNCSTLTVKLSEHVAWFSIYMFVVVHGVAHIVVLHCVLIPSDNVLTLNPSPKL